MYVLSSYNKIDTIKRMSREINFEMTIKNKLSLNDTNNIFHDEIFYGMLHKVPCRWLVATQPEVYIRQRI